MLIALLAVLGVNLAVIVVLIAGVLSRKRWVTRQDGSFKGAIRVSSGEIDGLGPKWGRGHGRWVRDVLVWTKGPFLLRNELVAVDSVDQERAAGPDEVKRLGDNPIVVGFTSNGATVDVAVGNDASDRLRGPFGAPGEAVVPAARV
jgi:Protein of unknown function (DUF2550)